MRVASSRTHWPLIAASHNTDACCRRNQWRIFARTIACWSEAVTRSIAQDRAKARTLTGILTKGAASATDIVFR